MYTVKLSKRAMKDRIKLHQAGLLSKAKKVIDVLEINPFEYSNRFEKLIGDLEGFYSRRINIQHRLVYSVNEDIKVVIVQSMWSHYE